MKKIERILKDSNGVNVPNEWQNVIGQFGPISIGIWNANQRPGVTISGHFDLDDLSYLKDWINKMLQEADGTEKPIEKANASSVGHYGYGGYPCGMYPIVGFRDGK